MSWQETALDRALKVRASLRKKGLLLKGSVSKGEQGALINQMDRAFGSPDERKICLSWLFFCNQPPLVPVSSKKLSDSQWLALKEWINADPENSWQAADEFLVDAVAVHRIVMGIFGTNLDGYDIVDPDGLVAQALQLGGEIRKENNEQR